MTVDDYKMILRTFRSVFPHATVWLTKDYSVLLATPVAAGDRLRASAESGSSFRRLRAALDEVDLGDPVSLVATLVLDEQRLGHYVGEGPVNTDDRPHISFGDRLRSGTQTGIPAMR